MVEARESCHSCGAPMEVFYLSPGDKAARCHYCGREVDLPDDVDHHRRDHDDELDSDEVLEIRRGRRPRRRRVDDLDERAGKMLLGMVGGLGVMAAIHPKGARRAAKRLYRARKRMRRGRFPVPFGRHHRHRRSRLVALALSFFLGAWGVDRFYLGQPVLGVLKLVTFGGCGVWWMLDMVRIATGSMRDGRGRKLGW